MGTEGQKKIDLYIYWSNIKDKRGSQENARIWTIKYNVHSSLSRTTVKINARRAPVYGQSTITKVFLLGDVSYMDQMTSLFMSKSILQGDHSIIFFCCVSKFFSVFIVLLTRGFVVWLNQIFIHASFCFVLSLLLTKWLQISMLLLGNGFPAVK